MPSQFHRRCAVLAVLSFTLCCSESSRDRDHKDEPAASNLALPFPEAFPSEELLEIALDVRDDDWDALRSEGRPLNDVFSGCTKAYDYTLVPARAKIDGRAHGELQVRKKGFLGSLSTTRPSLRLELGDEPYRGQPELTLNNNLSDPTLMHQCLAYALFGAAGLPAPHCALARVSVNGKSLGIYTNIEPIKRGFLERHFGSAEGNLYEGAAFADFRTGALDYFERKNNRKHPEREELEAVAAALDLEDDEEMLAALEPLVDLDQYIRFWAVEVLVGHWDGFSGNINNVYIYQDPRSNKLVLIPWGTDQAFETFHPFIPQEGRPPVTLALARLSRRLYAYEATRERYHAQLRELLEHVWDESALHSEIGRISQLLDGAPEPAAVEALRAFIDSRRAAIEQELDAALVPWAIPERGVLACMPEATTKISGKFSTTWGTLQAPVVREPGSDFELNMNGESRNMSGLAGAGLLESQRAALQVVSPMDDGRYLYVHLELPSLPRVVPSDIALHGFESFGVVGVSHESEQITLGYIGTGTIHFEHASREEGGEVSGRFEAMFSQIAAFPSK